MSGKPDDDIDLLNSLEADLRAKLTRMYSAIRRDHTSCAFAEVSQVCSQVGPLTELNRQSNELCALLGSIALDYIEQGNGKDDFSAYALRMLRASPALSTNLVLAEFVRSYYSPSPFARVTDYVWTTGYNLHNFFCSVAISETRL
jgi:hypothetical protein